jgi:hypothetical protein
VGDRAGENLDDLEGTHATLFGGLVDSKKVCELTLRNRWTTRRSGADGTQVQSHRRGPQPQPQARHHEQGTLRAPAQRQVILTSFGTRYSS